MSVRATDCDVCAEPIPFGMLAWLRHTGRKDGASPVVVLVCDSCKEGGK